MKKVFIITITVLLYGVVLMGCSPSVTQRLELPQKDFSYSFTHSPFVHPRILQDLTGWLSDSGNQVVAINLLDSQKSNRYFGKVLTRKIKGEFPFVHVRKDRTQFGYQYVGTTDSGLHILYISDNGGGSAFFKWLLLLTIEYDRGLSCDWDKLVIHPGRPRLLVKIQSLIGLGDRWSGELKVKGNELFIGKDKGWFSVSGGTGGGWLSNNPKDRTLLIDIDGHPNSPANPDKPLP